MLCDVKVMCRKTKWEKMKNMVKATYYYTCGCGFKTEDAEEAMDHVKVTGHKMDVKGMVTP
jgi:hypothetical protein